MARSSIRVRPAQHDDAHALARLVHGVEPGTVASSGPAVLDPDLAHIETRLVELIDADDRDLLVAVDDVHESAGPVGLLAARVDDVGSMDLTPVLHVTHLLVQPAHRRRGVGRALLAAAVHLAEAAGTDRVVATAATGSREGNRYLARLGFAPLVVHRIAPVATLHRSLGMTDATAGRTAVLRRARVLRAQRAGFAPRPVHRGA